MERKCRCSDGGKRKWKEGSERHEVVEGGFSGGGW